MKLKNLFKNPFKKKAPEPTTKKPEPTEAQKRTLSYINRERNRILKGKKRAKGFRNPHYAKTPTIDLTYRQ